jgi:hypothetical protein
MRLAGVLDEFRLTFKYYLDKNVASLIGQDAGYWMLDTGLN